MTTRHNLSFADQLMAGGAYFGPYAAGYEGRRGVLMTPVVKVSLGAPAAIVTTGLVASATSTELPNAATITYTTADDGVSPIDSGSRPSVASIVDSTGTSRSVWTLPTPRNVVLTVTHASSIVALTCVVNGYDVYGQAMSESLAVTATGTSKTTTGKKAFKYIRSYVFTSAGNATTDTALLGWGDTLGLPYRITAISDIIPFADSLLDQAGTTVVADDTTATAATGDVRGTYLPGSATDGTKLYAVWMALPDRTTKEGAFGITQA